MPKLSPTEPFIHPDCEITNAQFGQYVEVGKGARVLNSIIGDYSYLGANCSIRQNIKICNNVTIGMGGVVIKNIEEQVYMLVIPLS